MKKNRKMLGLAAAALLAVAPVVTTAVPVNADITLNNSSSNTNTSSTIKYNPTFYYNGNQLSNNAVVPTTVSVKNGDTLKSIADAVNKAGVQIQYVNSSNNLTSENIQVDATYIYNAVSKLSGVKISNGTSDVSSASQVTDKTTVTGLPAQGFNLALTYSSNNQTIAVNLPVSVDGKQVTQNANAPVFQVKSDNNTTSDRTFNIAEGSTFNPLDFTTADGKKITIRANQSSNSANDATITVTSNPVNTSEAGRFYTVTLTATNAIGTTSTLSYQVLVVSNGAQTLPADTPTYGIYGNNAVATGNTLKANTKIYVGSATRTVNNVSYTKISTTSKADADSSNSNVWIQTSALTAQPTTDANAETHTVMIDSRAYDKNGNYLGHMYYAYDDIKIVPTVVTINGKTYYKVADKDEYVRVTNITGNTRTLTHNAYIYWSSYRRTPGTGKMYKGQTVTTYGPAMRFKNGKKYYRIEGCRNNNKRYIKAANLSAAQ